MNKMKDVKIATAFQFPEEAKSFDHLSIANPEDQGKKALRLSATHLHNTQQPSRPHDNTALFPHTHTHQTFHQCKNQASPGVCVSVTARKTEVDEDVCTGERKNASTYHFTPSN